MERTEPKLVPEWLKNAGSSTGGSSISRSDDKSALGVARNKTFMSDNGRGFGGYSKADKTTSSYFRRSSSGNGYSHPRSYGSFGGRNQRDKEWEKDVSDSHDRGKLLNSSWRRDASDPLRNTSSGKYERDGLRRSESMISDKSADTWPNNVAKGSPVGRMNKATFARDFPSLGVDERAVGPEVRRVPSPGLSSAIQNLRINTSVSIDGDRWTALAEVPVAPGSNGTATLSAVSGSTPVALGTTTSLNMPETVSQGPTRAHTSLKLTVETQRLEELTIKQPKQLIPVISSMQKTSVVSPSDKLKPKVGQHHHPISSSLPVSHSPRMKGDISKASSTGNLQVLKPVREKNAVTPILKDASTPTSGGKSVSSTVAATTPSGSRLTTTSKQVLDRNPVLTVLEKRPTSQAQSRNHFFNLMRKKSDAKSSSAADSALTNSSPAPHSEKLIESGDSLAPDTPRGGDMVPPTADIVGAGKKGETTCNEDASDLQKHGDGEKRHPSSDPIFSEEEESAFLRSLGWEENDEEEGGLTEEEINAFCRDVNKYINSKTSVKILEGLQSKFLLPFQIQGISSGLSCSGTKVES